MSTRRSPHKARTIEKIRNAKVLERLIKHFKGELELSASQVNVGLNLIKKYIPDTKSVEMKIEGTVQIDKVKREIIDPEPTNS